MTLAYILRGNLLRMITAKTVYSKSKITNKPNSYITDPHYYFLMKKQIFDYSVELETELIQKIEESKVYDEKLDAIIKIDFLEDKLRSQKVAKAYKILLGLNDNEFNPIRKL